MMRGAVAGASAQVEFVAAGAGVSDADGTISVPYPAGIAADQFLLLHIYAAATGTPTVDTPGGWTLLDEESAISVLFWKSATGGESGNQDVTYTADIGAIGRMHSFSHGSGVESVASATDASADTTVTAVDVTTLGGGRMAVQAIVVNNNTTVAAMTGESGADYTEAVAEYSAALSTLSLQVAEVSGAVAITGGTATVGTSSTDIVHGFAIKP